MIQNTRLYNLLKEKNVDQEKVKSTTSRLKESTAEFFTTFNLATEEKLSLLCLKCSTKMFLSHNVRKK